MNIIELNELAFTWPNSQKRTISIDSLVIEQGKTVFLHGPSGSGKSTLLSLLTGINIPCTGSIKVLSTQLEKLNATQRDSFRAEHIGYIFQQFNLIPYLSVLDNVILPCRLSKQRAARTFGNYKSQAIRLLGKLQIDRSLLDSPITALSIGQQQRVAAARALIGSPELIIADEPCSALDDTNALRFIELLMQQCDETGSSLVFVSHDLRLAKQFDYCLSLSDFNNQPEALI